MFWKKTIQKELKKLKDDKLRKIAGNLGIEKFDNRKNDEIIHEILRNKKKAIQKELACFELEKLNKDKLNEIAGTLNLKNFANLTKPNLIRKILKETAYQKIAKKLGISWWERYKDDIARGVTIWGGLIGLMLGLWGFMGLPPITEIFRIPGFLITQEYDPDTLAKDAAQRFYQSAREYFRNQNPPAFYDASKFSETDDVKFEGMLLLDADRTIVGRVIISHNDSDKVWTLCKDGLTSTEKADRIRLAQGTVTIKTDPPSRSEWEKQTLFGADFIWIPGGCYEMGCRKSEHCRIYETPLHVVCVDGFWMGKSEITHKEWHSVMSGSESDTPENESKNNVTWGEVRQFLVKLNQTEKNNSRRFRLPTEAEWEYACQFRERAGLEGMTRGVWEWCQDIYTSDAYSRHKLNNPVITEGGSHRVIRGGDCCYPGETGCTSRLNSPPGKPSQNIGFRLVAEGL